MDKSLEAVITRVRKLKGEVQDRLAREEEQRTFWRDKKRTLKQKMSQLQEDLDFAEKRILTHKDMIIMLEGSFIAFESILEGAEQLETFVLKKAKNNESTKS